MEAWQHVELTGTNRSIGLRARHAQGQARTHEREIRDETPPDIRRRGQARPNIGACPPTRFDGLVVMARVPHPISIPNSAVKPLSADGTAS